MAARQTVKAYIRAYGVVQGVGFRPFVAKLAQECGIRGSVQNRQGHVLIEAVGTAESIAAMTHAISLRPPAAAAVIRVTREDAPGDFAMPDAFVIVPSEQDGEGPLMPSPDLAICGDCLKELFTPGDPRYLNPFISCTHCGPRFSIMWQMPYDRESITMDTFAMCPLCQGQYRNITDRRFHAQTVCCNACGPALAYQSRKGSQGLDGAVLDIKANQIVAVKGIGGYHLACSPFDAAAVARLRLLKGREDKAFAVMFETLEQVRAVCHVSAGEEALLTSAARPIVLLKRKPCGIASNVYGKSPYLGVFLPYTPLQYLLLKQTGPLIMTSANVSSLPIIKDDAEMAAFFEKHSEVMGVLSHDREILRRLDDSVVMEVLGQPLLLRRARGYAPLPLVLAGAQKPFMALGAQEKNALCLLKDGFAYLSQETGDLDTEQVQAFYQDTADDLQRLLRLRPEKVVCDKHPGYFTSAWAQTLELPVLAVQHHHAHIASVMAEHGLSDKVIGVAFDGTGYGDDGTIWGGEFLLASKDGYSREGHLKTVPFLGGDQSVRQASTSAFCLMADAGIKTDDPAGKLVQAAVNAGVNVIGSSSMGRVFDAVSAMTNICQTSRYGGQAAVELENAAARAQGESGPFPYDINEQDGCLIADLAPTVREIYDLKTQSAEAVAYGFHVTIAHLIRDMCLRLSKKHGVDKVALGGGVFQNRLLLELTVPMLQSAGLTVFRNLAVPPGDGGLALGQAQIALWSVK